LKGLGQAQKLAVVEAKNKIFLFILKNQPVEYKKIHDESHIRRNNVRSYVSELEVKKKIVKIDSKYFVYPPPQDVLCKENQSKSAEESFLTFRRSITSVIEQINKINQLEKEQPLRSKIIKQKMKISINHELLNDLIYFLENFNLNDLTKKSIQDFITISDVYLKTSIKFLEEFVLRFRLVTRFEYPRFKNKYKGKTYNPRGVHPRFRNKDGTVNYNKIERTYRFGIFSGLCPCCGDYVADYFNPQLKACRKLQKGKIMKEEYDTIVNHCKKHKLNYKVIPETDECPRDFMFNGKPLPEDLIIIK